MGESANVKHQLKGASLCVTERPSNAVAEASKWSEVMAKVIEFYSRGSVPKKVSPVPIEQRGQLVEFPEEEFAHSKTDDIAERGRNHFSKRGVRRISPAL